DYYYVIYEAALGVCLLLLTAAHWSIHRHEPGRLARRLSWLAAAAALLTLAAIAAIQATGGFDVRLGGRAITMRTIYNPLQIFWALAACWVLLRLRPAIV